MMPLGDGQTIDPKVLDSIAMQSVVIQLMPLSRPIEHFEFKGMDDVFKKKIRTNRKSISTTRNALKALAVTKAQKYILHIDSDVVFTSNHDVEDMIRFLDTNPKVGVVGLNTKDIELKTLAASHVSMACLLFRKEILLNYEFHNGKYQRDCNCQMLTNDLRKIPHPDGGFWEIQYLDNRKLYEVVRI
jgi:hypothetical protein